MNEKATCATSRSKLSAGRDYGREHRCKVSNILHFLAMPDFHDWGIIVIHAALTLRPAVSCVLLPPLRTGRSSREERTKVGTLAEESRKRNEDSVADPCADGLGNMAAHLKQFRPLKENLKGARRAPCLSMTTPPPVVEELAIMCEIMSVYGAFNGKVRVM